MFEATKFTGKVNTNMRKAYMQELASALKRPFSNTTTVPKLAEAINAHLKAHSQTLSLDPRFQGLYVYRSQNGAVRATSANKDALDAEEGNAKVQAPTGYVFHQSC